MNAANARVFQLLLMLELELIRGYPTLIIQRKKIAEFESLVLSE